jgi:hypothetical protein
VKLNRVLGNALLGEELEDLCSLVTLQLDHGSHILVVNQSSIACKLLENSLSMWGYLR